MRGKLIVRAVNLVAALLMCSAVVSPAEAQFGRLKKAAQDLAKEKLAPKTDDAKTAASTTSAAGESFVITPDHITLVLESVETAVVEAERLQASKRASTEYAKHQEAAKLCMDRLAQSYNPAKMGAPSEERSAEISRLGDESAAAQLRANAAMQRDDRRTYFAIQDTAQVLLQQSAVLTLGGSCTIPYVPLAVIDAQVAEYAGMKTEKLHPTAPAKSRMTHTQFGRVRERIALWALLQDDPSLKVGSEGVFSEAEQQSLKARNAEIKRLTPFFKDNTLRWSTWGDVSSW